MNRGLLSLAAAAALTLALVIPGTSAAAQRLESFEYPSELVNPLDEPGFKNPNRPSTLGVNVLLPDGFDRTSAEAKRGYPVLYLLHGANGYHRTWADDMHVADIAAGFPGIIVMPDGGVFGMYTDWNNRGAYGRPGWMSYHLNQLLESIESKYPIRSGRRWHAIAGVSMGGGGAVRYAAARPGYFGSVAAFSAAPLNFKLPEAEIAVNISGQAIGEGATFEDLWGPSSGFYATANNPQDLIPNLAATRVFITSGDGTLCPGDPLDTNPGDMVLESVLRTHATAFVDAAVEAGVDATEQRTCGAHSYPTSRRALESALAWGMFGEVPEDPHQWTYLTASPSGDAHGVRFEFDSQPTTLIRFTRNGDVLRGTGEGDLRIRFGKSCDFTVKMPFEVSLAGCQADPRAKTSLRLTRTGSILKLRSTGAVVRHVRLKVVRVAGKGKKTVSERRIGAVGSKNRRVRLKLKPHARYRIVARGDSGGRMLRKTLRFRTN
ncbi:MAG TPA: alpha/beta hydrolase family protein [Solirubrobacterales bacterium]|nr:alpha/beta hydrolase family protein [Solirubrobacterales bacterium]